MIEKRFPLHRFEEFGRLDPAESDALHALPGRYREVKKGRTICGESVPATSLFLLVSGWAMASHVVPDGGRQILKIHLPGDILGSSSMCMELTVEHLVAVTDVYVKEVSFADFSWLVAKHPRIGTWFMLGVQLERIALMDRLVSVARMSADASVAAFIIDLRQRLTLLGLVQEDSFELIVTQEQIGDVVGLTGVHVNRTMKRLTAQGLLNKSHGRIHIPDVAALTRLAGVRSRKIAVDPAWLSAAALPASSMSFSRMSDEAA